MPTDTNNLLYTIVAAFFALSMISERVANLYKLRTPKLRKRSDDQDQEKVREQGIMITAIASGILVAAVAGADFFTLINHGQLLDYTSQKWDYLLFLKTFAGILLTGIFISLGSKFWHDMLDIVLQISALKQSMAKKQDQENQQLKQDQLRNELIDKLNIITPKLQTLPGFSSYDIASQQGKQEVILKFNGAVPEKPEQLWYHNFFKDTPTHFINV
jgi:hypothetical protein